MKKFKFDLEKGISSLKNPNTSIKSRLSFYGFAILFLFSIVLLFLPSDFFDSGQSVCLSVLVFDQECYACGMTRACQHLLHTDFEEAYQFNKLSFLVLPLLIYMIGFEFFKNLKELNFISLKEK